MPDRPNAKASGYTREAVRLPFLGHERAIQTGSNSYVLGYCVRMRLALGVNKKAGEHEERVVILGSTGG
jgi:hypothetical protein